MQQQTLGAFGTNTDIDEGLRAHMIGTYRILCGGLLLSAAVAYAVLATPLGAPFFVDGQPTGLATIATFAPLALILLASFTGVGRSLSGMRAVFVAITATMGISLAIIVDRYTGASVVNAALATAAAFGSVSLWGYVTKRDLSAMGTFMLMGLVGIIVAMIANIFIGSAALGFAISVIAVVVFAGLAAWETQNLKEAYDPAAPADRMALMRIGAALGFFINIVNMFTAILGLTGDRD